MSKTTTKGICQFCHGTFSKGAMTRHLEACAQRTGAITSANQKSSKKMSLMHLRVEGRDDPQYWMHLEIPADATLQTLDNFLRDIWLECCGHLSSFEIAEQSYASYPDPEFGDYWHGCPPHPHS